MRPQCPNCKSSYASHILVEEVSLKAYRLTTLDGETIIESEPDGTMQYRRSVEAYHCEVCKAQW